MAGKERNLKTDVREKVESYMDQAILHQDWKKVALLARVRQIVEHWDGTLDGLRQEVEKTREEDVQEILQGLLRDIERDHKGNSLDDISLYESKGMVQQEEGDNVSKSSEVESTNRIQGEVGYQKDRRRDLGSPSVVLSSEWSGEEEQSLWQEVRRLNLQLPTTVEDVPHHLDALQQMLLQLGNRVQNREEGRRAHQRLGLLKQYQRYIDRLEEMWHQLERAERNLRALSRLRQEVAEIDLDVKGFLESDFGHIFAQDLIRHLRLEVRRLRDEVEARRNEVAQAAGAYVTAAMSTAVEDVARTIEMLEERLREGDLEVPFDPGHKVLGELVGTVAEEEGLAFFSDGGETFVNTADLIRVLRRRLVKSCCEEVERLLVEGERALEEHKLGFARGRYEAALRFLQVPQLPESDPRLDNLKGQLEALRERIEEQQRKHDEARTYADRAISAETPQEALRLLRRAEAMFPALDGLDVLKSERRNEWQVSLRQFVERTKRDALRQTKQRQYAEALALVREAVDHVQSQEELARYVDLDLSPYVGELLRLEEAVEEEWHAWQIFEEEQRRVLEQPPPMQGGTLDEARLREHFEGRVGADVATLFSREWRNLLSTLSQRAGAKAAYEQALRIFEQNPTDPNVRNILNTIGTPDDPELQKKVEALQRRHDAHVRVEALQRAFDHPPESLRREDIETWQSTIENLLLGAREAIRAVSDGEHAILERRVDEIERAFNGLRDVMAHCLQLVQHREFSSAIKSLDAIDSDIARTIEPTLQGLRALLHRRWRDEYMGFVERQVLWSGGGRCQARRNVDLRTIEQAYQYVQELADNHALVEEGDDERALCVRRLWHEKSLLWILNANSERPEELFESVRRFRGHWATWKQILDHLHALRQMPRSQGSMISPDLADQLYRHALVWCAAVSSSDDHERVVKLLQSLRSEQPHYYADPLICGLLALRYADVGDVDYLEDLSGEIERWGRDFQPLVEAVKSIANAVRRQEQQEWEQAERDLSGGVQSIRQLIRERENEHETEAAQLDNALNDASEFLLRAWRRRTCEHLLEEVERNQHRIRGRMVFGLLRKIYLARSVCPGDSRIEKWVERLEEESHHALQILRDDVNSLLNSPQDDLETAIREGEVVLADLKAALEMEQSRGERRSYQELKRLRESLEERIQVWRKLLAVIEETHDRLKELLEQEDWFWNTLRELKPNRTLRELEHKVRESSDPLMSFDDKSRMSTSTQVHNVLKNIQDLVVQVARDYDYEGIKMRYEGDAYDTIEDIKDDVKRLRDIRSMLNKRQREIEGALRQLKWHDIEVNFDRFFLLYDPYGIASSGEQFITSGEQVLKCVQTLAQNARRWQQWVEEVEAYMEELQSYFQNVRNTLQGGRLGEAEKMLGIKESGTDAEDTIPDLIEQLHGLVLAIPARPLTNVALEWATSFDDAVLLLVSDGEDLAADMLQDVRDASRDEIVERWQRLLEVERQKAERELKRLQEECQERRRRLAELIEQMNDHVRRTPDRRATRMSQEMYEELLREAERIDQQDEIVMSHRNRYERRRRIVAERSRR